MKVLYIVNTADSQSIPLELALAMKHKLSCLKIVSYYMSSDHPEDHPLEEVVSLGAHSAFDRAALLRLWALITEFQPDIIHTHHSTSALWSTIIAKIQRSRSHLVKTEHNDHRHMAHHHTAINHVLFPFQSRIVCNSDTTLASFTRAERCLAGDRTLRIYNGVDVKRVRKYGTRRTEKERPDGVFVLGHVGRLVPQKNQVRLIEAFSIARKQYDGDLRLEILGQGRLEATLQNLVRELNIVESVRLLGGVTRDEVYSRFRTWNAFIMPSIFEGFCNALVEAIAAGLPTAVSDLDTLKEVAGGGSTNFDPKNVDEMARAILRVTTCLNCDPSFADRYSIDHAAAEHISLYQELFEQRHP